jgi:2OG-Fe(II) oxygenase superfamily
MPNSTYAPFYFDRARLMELAKDHRDSYTAAHPFPHTVIDDLLPQPVVDALLDEFPGPQDIEWWTFDDARERKLGTIDDAAMGTVTRQVLAQLNSAAVIDFLQTLTGIDGLVPDPHLYGGGLHQIEPGGFLKVHADFNLHPVTHLERRLNLLIYLNRDWRSEYGGDLELWNADMSECGRRIEPTLNRCVIFTTTEHSFHGHPDPLRCPDGMTRKSIALYYYSAPTSTGETSARNTLFRARPAEVLPDEATTRAPLGFIRGAARRWLPPVVTDTLRSLRDKRRGAH